eukprot:TRINITY_DN110927_c0_g1_i1.p1 TRINITY_DN110927_c0_g1~~TRINITY_DN110927_c0_g1_i1.p1  ORF type:complete len:134 (-),score=17.99 TRINITY_DN110927_c0_g1_i1:48-449(-)
MPSPYASQAYQQSCLTSPVMPSLMWGTGFSLLGAMQGMPITPLGLATNCGLIYVYNAIQCPMEALHGKRSLLHNVAAGGLIGYYGVQGGRIGIPFLDSRFFYRYPKVTPPMAAFAVYGGLAGILGGALGGKSF